jgi:hypothetical protein
MKKRCELQFWDSDTNRWCRSYIDGIIVTLKERKDLCDVWTKNDMVYRVVQKLGRKVIKVIYPKGK